MGTNFAAPMGLSVKLITLMSLVLLAVLPLVILAAGGYRIAPLRFGLVIPILIALGTIPFAITGYTVTPDTLIVRRPGRQTTIPLAGLRSVEADPQAMARSLRTFGNGGLFAVSGHFRNRALGKYQAFVTDTKRLVVLKFDDRTFVVSPGEVDEFVKTLKSTKNL